MESPAGVANLYFEAAGTAAHPPTVPLAWRPLIEQREQPGIEPIQFALAGTINSARDLAWTDSQLLWQVRNDQLAYDLLCESLAASTQLAARLLLVAV